MKAYLGRHAQVFMRTLGDFARSPAATLLTVAMIGVTLMLPTGLYVALLNLQRLSHHWQPRGSLTVYLKRHTDTRATAARLDALPGVAASRYISPEQGLQELRTRARLRVAVGILRHNPLPAVVILRPRSQTAHAVAALARQVATLPGVAHVESNFTWLRRLDAVLALGHRAVAILAALLGLALVLILGNTTRASVASRAAEISVVRLVGGTNAFIRRPFLYAGALAGGLGALCALIFLELALWALDGPVQRLDTLYGSAYKLVGLGAGQALGLLALGAGLGWLGARIAVGHQLRRDQG